MKAFVKGYLKGFEDTELIIIDVDLKHIIIIQPTDPSLINQNEDT
jgi:hypothetical protein